MATFYLSEVGISQWNSLMFYKEQQRVNWGDDLKLCVYKKVSNRVN